MGRKIDKIFLVVDGPGRRSMSVQFSPPSLLRSSEHEELSKIVLSGTVLDLGGDRRSDYQAVFGGKYILTTVNYDQKTRPDIVHDLETPLSIVSSSFDNVLLINVLEHIFHYRELLAESFRVLKLGGQIVVVVPFLFPVHPSPSDYHRFTAEALRKELGDLRFENIEIISLGGGVFSACYLSIDRLLPRVIQWMSYYSLRYFVQLLDVLMIVSARAFKKKYNPAHYALGYCVTAQKLAHE